MAKLLVIDEVLKGTLLQAAPVGGGAAGTDAADDSDDGGAADGGRLLKFQMPNGDHEQRLFLLQDTVLYELQQPTLGGKTSWFMDDEVISDGSFYLATPFQPIFLLLPLLEASASHFTGKAQLLAENPQFHALRRCANLDLSLVCEVKEAGGEQYFKLSRSKLEAWLRTRVSRVQAVLNTRRIAGSHLVNLVAAIDILAEYLSAERFAALRDSYGIRDYKKEAAKASFQSNKRRIIGDDADVAEVASGNGTAEQKGGGGARGGGGWNRKADAAAAAQGVRKKAKLQAKPPKGMKSMFSFFSKVPPKQKK